MTDSSATKLSRRAALAVGASLVAARSRAATDLGLSPPHAGDLLVFETGPHAGAVITLDAVPPNQPLLAWAMEPETRVVHDRSRFDQVLLVRLDPPPSATASVPAAGNGILAFSAICTHAGCFVAGWKAAERQFLCPCHGSVYDPAAGGRVVAGPAPRPLPALPLRIDNGTLIVAGGFTGQIGGSTGRTD